MQQSHTISDTKYKLLRRTRRVRVTILTSAIPTAAIPTTAI